MLVARAFVKRLPIRAGRWHHSTSCRQPLNSVTNEDLAHFAKILPQNAILSTLAPTSLLPDELEPYNNDWMGKYHGKSTTVLKPYTTEQVSGIVRWCHERRIGIVPQGGNTGLVGGGVPLRDELIINLSNMSNVRSFDPVSGKVLRNSSPRARNK